MEPRLNVKIANLFLEPFGNPNPVDVDFIPQGQQMDNDFIDADSNDAAQNWQVEQSWRSDWANEIDRDNASGQAHGADPTNPGSQTAPYGQPTLAARQAQGFNNRQARRGATFGVLAEVSSGTLVGSRVYAKTAKTNVRGTVVALGDREFAVVWDDRTASVERKSDFELVVKN